jgi:hypothetical protein
MGGLMSNYRCEVPYRAVGNEHNPRFGKSLKQLLALFASRNPRISSNENIPLVSSGFQESPWAMMTSNPNGDHERRHKVYSNVSMYQLSELSNAVFFFYCVLTPIVDS